MRRMPRPAPPPRLDKPTLDYAIRTLEERLRAVETYGAGGCPTCHDAELRGALATLRVMRDTPAG
jgi:hypothetical protein